MHGLIKRLLLKRLYNPLLGELSDAALLPGRLAFTTDSFVVNPLFFDGGDIGKLAVYGTVNDLVMQGARPCYLSLGMIIEEGLEMKVLERVVASLARAARGSGVFVVTGDLKVVEKGACDKLFINTSGIGTLVSKRTLSLRMIEPGDKVIVTGDIGRHGLAVAARREGLDWGFRIKSDCAALGGLLIPLVEREAAIRFMRDPTRGGLATTLSEIALARNLGIVINERSIPVSPPVRAACELLGIDPLHLANEGRAVLVVAPHRAGAVVRALRRHALGRNAALIGEVAAAPKGTVVMRTSSGSERLVGMPSSELLPRIC